MTQLRRRVKLSDTPSSSSPRHEIARVHADMEINAIEALSHAKLEVDRALDKANEDVASLVGRNVT